MGRQRECCAKSPRHHVSAAGDVAAECRGQYRICTGKRRHCQAEHECSRAYGADGKRVLDKRTAKLDGHCRFAVTFKIKRTLLSGVRKLTVVIRFAGNHRLGRRTDRVAIRAPKT